MISFHKHSFSAAEISAVTRVLRNKWVTNGPENEAFEADLASYLGLAPIQVVGLSSATAGLFLSLKVFGVGRGDEVITSPYSFVATANVIVECGAKPVFADINADGLLNPEEVARCMSPRTKAVIPVDYAGYPADYLAITKVLTDFFSSGKNKFRARNPWQEALARPLVLADSAHSIGTLPVSTVSNRSKSARSKISTLHYADMHCYSFHAAKNITTAEGGALTVVHPSLSELSKLSKGAGRASRSGMINLLRQARLHGMNKDARSRLEERSFFYDVPEIGYKYNLTEMQAALGRVQLKKLDTLLAGKTNIQAVYDLELTRLAEEHPELGIKIIQPTSNGGNNVADKGNKEIFFWRVHPHLYTVFADCLVPTTAKAATPTSRKKLLASNDFEMMSVRKEKFFQAVYRAGVALNFHYRPIPLMSAYRKRGYSLRNLPVTAGLYPGHFSLPFYAGMNATMAKKVVKAVEQGLLKCLK